jgi:hypothetical protein
MNELAATWTFSTFSNSNTRDAAVQSLGRLFNIRGHQGVKTGNLPKNILAVTDDIGRITLNMKLLTPSNVYKAPTPQAQLALAVVVWVHESVHREQSRAMRGHPDWSKADVAHQEYQAYQAARVALKELLKAGTITQEEYDWVLKMIERGETKTAEDYGGAWCLACFAQPDKHMNVDLAKTTWKRRSQRYIEGLWGVEYNPDGPGVPQ